MINIALQKKLHGADGDMTLKANLQIKEKEFVALHGKSGSGKTTLLRILAGLEEADAEISVGNTIWQDRTTNLAVQKREIGFVFQDYALFENMNVEENLLYVQKDKELAKHLLEVTELYELKDKYPNTLSGGQKQRVSICRALMKKPKILLLDEPFSALDSGIRDKLQRELLALHKEFQTTTIMVSHNLEEIHQLASRILVLEKGEIIQDGSPQDLLHITQVESFTL